MVAPTSEFAIRRSSTIFTSASIGTLPKSDRINFPAIGTLSLTSVASVLSWWWLLYARAAVCRWRLEASWRPSRVRGTVVLAFYGFILSGFLASILRMILLRVSNETQSIMVFDQIAKTCIGVGIASLLGIGVGVYRRSGLAIAVGLIGGFSLSILLGGTIGLVDGASWFYLPTDVYIPFGIVSGVLFGVSFSSFNACNESGKEGVLVGMLFALLIGCIWVLFFGKSLAIAWTIGSVIAVCRCYYFPLIILAFSNRFHISHRWHPALWDHAIGFPFFYLDLSLMKYSKQHQQLGEQLNAMIHEEIPMQRWAADRLTLWLLVRQVASVENLVHLRKFAEKLPRSKDKIGDELGDIRRGLIRISDAQLRLNQAEKQSESTKSICEAELLSRMGQFHLRISNCSMPFASDLQLIVEKWMQVARHKTGKSLSFDQEGVTEVV